MTLKEATALLYKSGIEDAAYEARLIFSTLSGIPTSRLVTEDPEGGKEITDAVFRRCEREPLAYVLGFCDFYRERYRVSRDCLVPRQETELLVDYAVKNIPSGESFLDLCTGSGCIAISVLKNTENTTATAVDISRAALDIARENATVNSVCERVCFIEADVLCRPIGGEVFALLSNPPYVRDSVYEELAPEVLCEPKAALLGGEDGADFYRRITALYKDKIKRGGFILFEIGFDQGEILKNIAKEHGFCIEIMKDYSGLDRLALLRRD